MREAVLHLMVLSTFLETLAVGPISIGRVVAVLALLSAAAVVLARPHEVTLPPPSIALPAAGLAVWMFLSGMWATSAPAWTEAVLQLALGICYFIGYFVLPQSFPQIERLLATYLVGALASSVLGILQAVFGIYERHPDGRAVGWQGDPNTYAMYLVCAIPILVHLARRRAGGTKGWWLVLATLPIFGVLAAMSRGGLLALVVVLAWQLWHADLGGRAARTPATLTVLGLSTSAAAVVGLMQIVPRFQVDRILAGGGTGRLDIWRVAWQAWLENPLLGVGAGNFEALSRRLLTQTPGVGIEQGSDILTGIKIHNSYLGPLTELGPVGLGLYLAILVGAGLSLAGVRTLSRTHLVASLLPMLIGVIVATTFIYGTNNKLLWMLVGLAACLPRLIGQRDEPAAAIAEEGYDQHNATF